MIANPNSLWQEVIYWHLDILGIVNLKNYL
jgi:hypothetical protein